MKQIYNFKYTLELHVPSAPYKHIITGLLRRRTLSCLTSFGNKLCYILPNRMFQIDCSISKHFFYQFQK
jgi:hypothetical protein